MNAAKLKPQLDSVLNFRNGTNLLAMPLGIRFYGATWCYPYGLPFADFGGPAYMPLPNFDNFRIVWIEKTKSSHGHSGKGFEFATCLWSPTTDKLGRRIYKDMAAARDGDLVLHFYEDTPYGKESDYYFCGVSVIDGAAERRDQQPPRPGEWAGRPQYYRISLRDFTSFAEPLALRNFVRKYDAQIIEILNGEKDQPFIIYSEHRAHSPGTRQISVPM